MKYAKKQIEGPHIIVQKFYYSRQYYHVGAAVHYTRVVCEIRIERFAKV